MCSKRKNRRGTSRRSDYTARIETHHPAIMDIINDLPLGSKTLIVPCKSQYADFGNHALTTDILISLKATVYDCHWSWDEEEPNACIVPKPN